MIDLMAEVEAASIAPATVALWWLGQSGYLLKTPAGTVIAIDPYLTASRSDGGQHARLFPPPIAPEALRCQAIFCSHDHPDHADPETLGPALAAMSAMVAGPASVCARLARLGVTANRLRRLAAGDSYVVGDVVVRAVHALHGPPAPPERLPRRPLADALGWVVSVGPVRLYHTGDTLLTTELFAVSGLRPTAVLACINGRGGNMNADEAATLVAHLTPRIVIPMHYGCLVENTVDPQTFVAAVERLGLTSRVVVLAVGQRFDLAANSA
jgi:L-ascorbate 6-phosphate lactonase